jgi:hypothetical protein
VCKLKMLSAPNAGRTGTGGSPRSRFSTYRWSSFPGRVTAEPNKNPRWLDLRGSLHEDDAGAAAGLPHSNYHCHHVVEGCSAEPQPELAHFVARLLVEVDED